ncbi:MAG: alpha/beta fold hydrolase, partial [Rhodospirillales bacterium]|nr:alpha/beta fold hydrolase [Rhodospirillales bacterium]
PRLRLIALLLALVWLRASPAQAAADRYFTASDGVRLHYLLAGQSHAHTLVFIPGWTMPAWIWDRQIAAFSTRYRVIAFDPRGQGDSAIPATGYTAPRRGQDIAELLGHIDRGGHRRVVVIAWSLGVLDTLAMIAAHGPERLAGLVAVDNSVGEYPAPHPPPYRPPPRHPPSHAQVMAAFVRAMFRRPQPRAWLDRLIAACLRVPEPAARALLSYAEPRSFWRMAIYRVHAPVLYIVRPGLAGQAASLARGLGAETAIFADAGHALFIDDAARFDALLGGFLTRRVWPAG